MALNPLLAAGLIMSVLAGLFVVCSVALVLVILIQKGRGGGLSSAFGGGMASGILGSKTGDVLTWITIGVVSVFLLVALILNKWWRPAVSGPQARPAAAAPAADANASRPLPAPVQMPSMPGE